MTAADFGRDVQRSISAMVREGERMAQDPTPEELTDLGRRAAADDHDTPAPNAAELATAARGDPAHMTRDDWDDVYMDCESNGEGEPRSMVRYAYEAGWRAARGVK